MADSLQMIDPAHYHRLRTIISPHLYYKSFNLREKQILANELIWKWTEATGKYIGCQFWSVEAQDLFNAELRNRHGKITTFDRA
jgi:hypothetical protein